MRNRGNQKTIRILGVVGKPLSNLAASVASKGLKPKDVETKILERSKDITQGTPIVISVLMSAGNVYTVSVRPGPTMDLVKHLQPNYKEGVKSTTVQKIAEWYLKHNVLNTNDLALIRGNISNILFKSCKLTVEGYGGTNA